jgi:hypothetical protein
MTIQISITNIPANHVLQPTQPSARVFIGEKLLKLLRKFNKGMINA